MSINFTALAQFGIAASNFYFLVINNYLLQWFCINAIDVTTIVRSLETRLQTCTTLFAILNLHSHTTMLSILSNADQLEED